MKTTEIRVRPVIRHIVTRYHGAGDSPACLETLGEFDNEAQAEELAEALRKSHRPRQYAIVQRSFEVDVKVYYAESEGEAIHRRDELMAETGKEFRIYERELTDPVAIAMHSVRPQLPDSKSVKG